MSVWFVCCVGDKRLKISENWNIKWDLFDEIFCVHILSLAHNQIVLSIFKLNFLYLLQTVVSLFIANEKYIQLLLLAIIEIFCYIFQSLCVEICWHFFFSFFVGKITSFLQSMRVFIHIIFRVFFSLVVVNQISYCQSIHCRHFELWYIFLSKRYFFLAQKKYKMP